MRGVKIRQLFLSRSLRAFGVRLQPAKAGTPTIRYRNDGPAWSKAFNRPAIV